MRYTCHDLIYYHLNYSAMSHAKTSPDFNFPGRPWEYTHEDVASMARESGIVDESAIEFEIRCWASGEWRGVLHMAKRQKDASGLTDARWATVLATLRERHAKAWGRFSDA